MAGLLAVITNNSVTGFGDVAGLVAMTARTRLTFVAKVNKGLAEAHKTRDGLLDLETIMTDAILYILPAFETKHTTAVGNHITILGKTVNDRGVQHLVRRVENL